MAQYSRPAFAEEGQSQQEQQELCQPTPELSLKFALPPVAQVRLIPGPSSSESFSELSADQRPASPHRGSAQ